MKHAMVAVLAASGIARADELTATLEQPLVEVSHAVDIRIADGVATYRVRRQFANRGKRADEASLAIDLPYGAAATGLRIRARDRWYDGELMERERAAALYQELTGLGAWQPKDPALLQWQWADKLHLQVFPVMPGQVSTVEYTLTVPTRYAGGRYWLSYPRVAGVDADRAGLPLAIPTVTVRPAWGDATTPIAIDGKPAARDTQVVLAPPPREAWQDAIAADPGASYAASAIEVPASSHTTRPIASAKITLDIAHTFKSDLRVELVTPQGKAIALHDGQGGDRNGIREMFTRAMPPGTTGAGTWRLVASDRAALDTGAIDGWSIAFGEGVSATTAAAADTPVFIPDAPENGSDAGVAAISIAPPAIATWTARLGRVVASGAHAFARLEIDVAPQLTPLPRRAQVVFVVDASFSVGAEHLAAQLDVIRAYLGHVPDAEVEVIAVRRGATRVFGAFLPAAAAIERLADPHALALGNGSAVDDGARLATAALADRSGPRRMVITTDELWRDALTPERALAAFAALSPATVVHLVDAKVDGDDRVTMARADDDRFAAIATRHHGIAVLLRGVPAHDPKALAPVVLELVRPTKIDRLQVTGLPTDVTALHEGEGLRLFERLTTAPEHVAISGLLWSDPIRKHLAPAGEFSRQTAAFVFGADEHHELSREEMMTVALKGRAVSPVTSYVAAEPGTRPSTIGLPGRGLSGRGAGTGHGAAYAMGGRLRARPDLRTLIDTTACEQQVKPAAGWRVALDVETTLDEIVDVIPTARDAMTDPMTACVVETTWRVRLDPEVFRHTRERFHVELAGR